jgi:hypothetical protein
LQENDTTQGIGRRDLLAIGLALPVVAAAAAPATAEALVDAASTGKTIQAGFHSVGHEKAPPVRAGPRSWVDLKQGTV